MPNWVITEVTVKGPEKEIDKVRRLVKDAQEDQEHGLFHQIVPMPTGADENGRSWETANWGASEDVCGDGFWTEDAAPDQMSIGWKTPWDFPDKVVEALWNRLEGRCLVEGVFADEDLGFNCGIFKVVDGHCVIIRPEDPYGLACRIWEVEAEEEDDGMMEG